MIDRLNHALEGRYRIESELGEGGMAMVFLAQDLRHDRQVALKVLRPELAAVVGADRFLAEIKTTANLQHPHILPLFDSGEADSFLFYVMPHVEGETLRERVEKEVQLPVKDALAIAEKIAAALQYAHEQGVVHRDIKPANILMSRGEPLVADFGIALAVSEAGGGRITETGLSLGTPHYMSPEQAAGERTLDKRSDVYALGCVLYEMLTGQPPYGGPTAQAVLGLILTSQPVRPTDLRKTIPVNVEHAILKALEKLPADRFNSAADFIRALENPSFRLETEGEAAGAGAGAPGWRVATIALGLLAVVLGGLLFVWPRGDPTVSRQRVVLFQESPNLPPLAVRYGLALAPDGSAIITASPPAELLGMSLKEAGDVRGTIISGTESGYAPTFSPDGRWIAFFHDEFGLRKVPRRGGSPITLSDSPPPANSADVVWLEDGTLVFVTRTWGLARVDEVGGPVEQLLAPGPDAGGAVVHLSGLPNARGVVYSVCQNQCTTAARVGVFDLASGEASILVEDAVGGWYVPSVGHLLFARRNGGVFAAPFSLKELRITGPELPVLEGVRMGQSYAPLQLGEDGTLVYLAGENLGTLTNEQIVWVDRNGNTTPVDGDWWGNFESIALSPDGTLLAVTDESSQRAIWVKELPDGPLTRLTPDGPNNRRPAWTPDGRYVAYQAGDTATGQVFDIRRFDASTEARRFIGLEAEGSEAPQDSVARSPHQVSFSRDGRYVVYRIGGVPEGDLRYMEISGADTVHHDLLVRPGTNEVMPVLSPDSRWLAYVSDVSGTPEVYVRPFPEVMTSRVKVSEGGGWEPLWSHDETELFYRDGDGMLVAAAVEFEPTFRVTGRDPLFLRTGGNFSTNADEQRYDVAADGRFLMVGLRGSTAGEPEEAPAGELIMVKNWFAELREILKGQLKR